MVVSTQNPLFLVPLILLSFIRAIIVWIIYFFYWLIPRRFRFKDISDDVVLITGAGSGLGRSLALNLLSRAKKVIAWDIDAEGLAETQRLASGRVTTYQVNVADQKAVQIAAERVRREVGSVTILINNAGVVVGKELAELTEDQVRRTFNVNVISHFWTIQVFLPDMIRLKRGHLVTISSMCGYVGLNKLADYCASKFAAVGLTEALAAEHRWLKTLIVAPSQIGTGMFAGFKSAVPELSPDYVAREVIAGILSNQTMLMLPRVMYILYSLKTMMPMPAFEVICNGLGAYESMTGFIGRQTNNQNNDKKAN